VFVFLVHLEQKLVLLQMLQLNVMMDISYLIKLVFNVLNILLDVHQQCGLLIVLKVIIYQVENVLLVELE